MTTVDPRDDARSDRFDELYEEATSALADPNDPRRPDWLDRVAECMSHERMRHIIGLAYLHSEEHSLRLTCIQGAIDSDFKNGCPVDDGQYWSPLTQAVRNQMEDEDSEERRYG